MNLSENRPMPIRRSKIHFLTAVFALCIASCGNHKKADVTKSEVVATPQEINVRAEDLIQGTLNNIIQKTEGLPDSLKLRNATILQGMYEERSYQPIWSSDGQFTASADSIFRLLDSCRNYGLLPDDYYSDRLRALRSQLLTDTSKQKKLDASRWALSDMMLSSAFVQLIKDVRIGRLLPDSVVRKDSSLTAGYFAGQLPLLQKLTVDSFVSRLEPANTDYRKLRGALPKFLQNAHIRNFTYVSSKDSATLASLLYKRLREEDSTLSENPKPDSTVLAAAIRAYQSRKKIKVDGRKSADLIARLNNNDAEKFLKIALNLDRYKQTPSLPDQYIWVNIPSYYLQVRQADTVVMKSKVCVGKPETRTPYITSSVTDMITYPKWTIPESIVKKEILPGLIRDPGYTIKKGFSLVDDEGNEIDPYAVKWSKYKDYIPYKVVQGSGDANALGVLKFNFPNKFSVYLHDTNQRYLFSKSGRALSHGCVRVQSWYELSKFILQNDSLNSTNAISLDSLDSWLAAKQKRYVPVRKPVPLFIRYFTCDVNDGKVVFFEDIYSEDKRLRDKLLMNKSSL